MTALIPAFPRQVGLGALALGLALLGPTAGAAQAGDDVELLQFLTSTGVDSDAKAKARWRDKGDSIDFKVEIEQVPAQTYELWVAGVNRGVLLPEPGEPGEFEAEFENPLDPPKPLFNFDVFNQLIEVRDTSGVVYISDVFAPSGGGGSGGGSGGSSGTGSGGGTTEDPFSGKGRSKIETILANVSGTSATPDFNAKGRLRFESRPKKGFTEVRFEVDTENLDAAEYEVRIDGVGGPAITPVFDATGFIQIEIDFRLPVSDDPPMEAVGNELDINLPLDFDPLGRSISVVRIIDGAVVLEGVLPETKLVSGVRPPNRAGRQFRDLGRTKADRLQIELLNNGVVHRAQGQVILEQGVAGVALGVKLEDVPAGEYGVFVSAPGSDGATPRLIGSLDVIDDEGEVVFATLPVDGALPLDLDATPLKGQHIEVRAGDDVDDSVVLSAFIPSSVLEGTGRYRREQRRIDKHTGEMSNASLNLINAGGFIDAAELGDVTLFDDPQFRDLDASGSLRWSLRKGIERLQVSLKDLPAGHYVMLFIHADLSVDAVHVEVGDNGRLNVKLDSSLDPLKEIPNKRLVLQFEALGSHLLVVDDDGRIVLQAVIE